MSVVTNEYVIEFPADYDDQSEYEMPLKGYLSEVVVCVEGARYQLFFIDPVRLRQELIGEIGEAQAYFWEPNLVVLPEVTTELIRVAVAGLIKERFFQFLKPL